jgi:hypothetical protein|tara:strand:+ start:222 stop:404 length:183 start_codon:yes stop_codon:yes gene_type:complete
MDQIDEIFSKSATGDLTPVDVENIVFLSAGMDFEESLKVAMIFEGIDLIANDKTNKVFNP